MDWHHLNTDLFWAEEACNDHVVQVYENDETLINSLTKFVTGGIKMGDPSIIIATESHLHDLKNSIKNQGYDLESLQHLNLFIALNASEVLSKFMINDWPDDPLFEKTVSEIINKVPQQNHKIRAFGEMVSILWDEELHGATIYLEHLWNKFCSQQPISLLCAYPKKAFRNSYASSLQHICKSHSKMIGAVENGSNEITYRNTSDLSMSDLITPAIPH
ncbi:MAG TPA: MEDS domain-containing protein [Puia sp.]|jgi:hypothetical protein|nr:MEDS domain-containing protein [Puia sp.]